MRALRRSSRFPAAGRHRGAPAFQARQQNRSRSLRQQAKLHGKKWGAVRNLRFSPKSDH
jgi:hypothetical protein